MKSNTLIHRIYSNRLWYGSIYNIFLLLWSLLLLSPLYGFSQQPVSDPNPHRFDAEIQAFVDWDAKNSFPADAILFVGSSSIRFWKTHHAFPDYKVINRGFGGAHISDVDYFYKEVIARYDPSAIVFYAGDNDVAAGKTVDRVIEDYRRLVERVLQDYPDIQWLYVPIKPSSSRWSYRGKMQAVNNWIKKHHQQDERFHYVDLATPLLNNEGQPNDSLFQDDLLHLNAEGYAIWNRIMDKKLEELYN